MVEALSIHIHFAELFKTTKKSQDWRIRENKQTLAIACKTAKPQSSEQQKEKNEGGLRTISIHY